MIREYLSKILSARYGRDVRQAIHDSIQQCYYDGKAGEIDLQARQDIETLNGEVESLKGADIAINENIQALGNAMDESFRALGNEVEGLKDADNTINQTLQELGDDVAGLKVSTNDIVETTETTMPNSCEGRLRFKEIRGKTEKLTSTGKNLLNLRDGVNAVGDGVAYTNRGDGTYSRVGTATGITGNAWIKGGYVEGVPSTEITNPIMTLKLGKSYFIGDCILFSVTKDGVSYGVTGAVTIQNEDAKIVGVRNTGQLVGHSYNDVIYPRVFEGLVDLGWEPYGVDIPFIRNVEIRGINTHGKNWFDKNNVNNFNGYIDHETLVSHASHKTLCIPCQPNTDYTVSKISSLRFSIAFSSEIPNDGVSVTNRVQNNTGTVLTSNSGANGKYLLVWYYIENDSDINAILDSIQIEVGTVATEYEPYKESVVTPSQPIELLKIGNMQDVIVNGSFTKRLAKAMFNGSETGWVADSNNRFYIPMNVMAKKSDYSNCIMSCKYSASMNHVNMEDYSVSGYADLDNNHPSSNWLYIRDSDANDLASFKAKLQANPVTVVYELATPITPLSTEDQVALNSIKTFDGTTYLEFDSPLEPEFVAEYGTSKVGGVALEAKSESQANGENIEEMNSVLGAMNTILQDAFIPRGNVPVDAGGDANLCVKSGIYRTGANILNVPHKNGFLITFAWMPNVLIQVCMTYSPQYLAIRSCWYGTWLDWYNISTTKIS